MNYGEAQRLTGPRRFVLTLHDPEPNNCTEHDLRPMLRVGHRTHPVKPVNYGSALAAARHALARAGASRDRLDCDDRQLPQGLGFPSGVTHPPSFKSRRRTHQQSQRLCRRMHYRRQPIPQHAVEPRRATARQSLTDPRLFGSSKRWMRVYIPTQSAQLGPHTHDNCVEEPQSGLPLVAIP